MNWSDKLKEVLKHKAETNHLRTLERIPTGFQNLSSNDYLNLRNSEVVRLEANKLLESFQLNEGSGSRLLGGNRSIHEAFESWISSQFYKQAVLSFNSGYAANLSFFSSIPQNGQTIIFDEHCHASIRQGMKLSRAKSLKFKHNNLEDLKRIISSGIKPDFIVCEALYSMNGDYAPINELHELAQENNCCLFVDEAHSIGIVGGNGKGLSYEFDSQNLVRMLGFGKAIGATGACIIGPEILKSALINFGSSFIYSTSPTDYSVAQAWAGLKLAFAEGNQRTQLQELVEYWKGKSKHATKSPIQYIPFKKEDVTKWMDAFRSEKIYLKPIYPPTVPEGSERFRLSLTAGTLRETLDRLAAITKSIS